MSTNLTEKEFAQHVGTEFQLKLDQQDISLKLADVTSYRPQDNEEGGMERFSVFFDGPADIRVPQETHTLRHEKMGEFEIFLSTIRGDDRGFRYEAVFNYYKK